MSLFRWSGWSLVAPRPGNTLSNDYKSVSQDSEAAQQLNIKLDTEPSKGSLPRLRFGVPYKLRARAVDIAGNSITLEEGNQLSSGPQGKQIVIGDGYVYRRYEPVAQPFVLPHAPLANSNGESAERMVIRSYNTRPELDNKPSAELSQRHIVPTSTSQQLAEAHGQFDDANGRPLPGAYQAIINHDNRAGFLCGSPARIQKHSYAVPKRSERFAGRACSRTATPVCACRPECPTDGFQQSQCYGMIRYSKTFKSVIRRQNKGKRTRPES